MKFLTYRSGSTTGVAVMKKDGAEIVPVNYLGCGVRDMNDLIEVLTEEKKQKIERNAELMQGFALADVEILSPIPYPKQDVICLGVNYFDHGTESAKFLDNSVAGDHPDAIYFSKRVNRTLGDGEEIDGHFDIVEGLDYEVELAVVIGKEAKNVSEADAYDYILGYTILNDMSARNLQKKHNQWYFGKSLDDFTPIGPWIVTKDEFEMPVERAIRCYVNGELRQESNTKMMITGIAQMISELSQGMTLKAGTIIATGTPAGVGMGFEPPKYLKKGDVVKCEIEGIGVLTNTIK